VESGESQLQQLELAWDCSDAETCRKMMGSGEYHAWSSLHRKHRELREQKNNTGVNVTTLLELGEIQ
jgi:hypothetical protein